jgi:hypothetical protein
MAKTIRLRSRFRKTRRRMKGGIGSKRQQNSTIRKKRQMKSRYHPGKVGVGARTSFDAGGTPEGLTGSVGVPSPAPSPVSVGDGDDSVRSFESLASSFYAGGTPEGLTGSVGVPSPAPSPVSVGSADSSFWDRYHAPNVSAGGASPSPVSVGSADSSFWDRYHAPNVSAGGASPVDSVDSFDTADSNLHL